jgi:predicted phosphoadenosine phosphosulfate sulfurtransferase
MNNPYEIKGPTCISFSGGRTSAYMLHKVLQAGGGATAKRSKGCLFCQHWQGR